MSIRINGTDRESQLHIPASMEHGMYHVNDNTKYYEPQRSTDFEFIVDGADIENLVSITTGERIYNAQEILRMAVIKCPIPHFKIQELTQRRGNSVTKFAGTPEFNGGNITVRDWIGVDTKGILMAWQHLAYDVNTDKTGILSDYKKNCTLIEYSPDKQVVRQWKMYGCWVSNIEEPDYDHEGSQQDRQITATIAYDKAVLVPDDNQVYSAYTRTKTFNLAGNTSNSYGTMYADGTRATKGHGPQAIL